MPAPVYAPLASAMEPAPQPVVRDDVVLTPAQPKQAMVYEAPAMPEQHYHDEPMAQGAFIPPQAERAMRPARMPRIDELPIPAQNQIRASRGEPAHEPKPMSLLQRLATVGFGRKDEGHPEPAPQRQPRGSAPADVPGSCGIRQAPDAAAGLSSCPGPSRPAGKNGSGAAEHGRRPARDSGLPAPPGELTEYDVTALQPPALTRPGAFL